MGKCIHIQVHRHCNRNYLPFYFVKYFLIIFAMMVDRCLVLLDRRFVRGMYDANAIASFALG